MNLQHINKAELFDQKDPLSGLVSRFHKPASMPLYFAGNSLGLQPVTVTSEINEELRAWADLGVEAHFESKVPWMTAHESVTLGLCRLVGASPEEVVAMNALTVNLHLLMLSFFRPHSKRKKILIESGAFPSDRYAVMSQLRFHGLSADDLIEWKARPGERLLCEEDCEAILNKQGDEIALMLLGHNQYLTGQVFDVRRLCASAKQRGVVVGLDCAHGIGNLDLQLAATGCDFATWCTYKYVNAGPGGISGIFVNKKHSDWGDRPRLEGWWGHEKASRFKMPQGFIPSLGAEGWQLSNPPIFQLAALRASLSLFDEAQIARLEQKGRFLSGFLIELLDEVPKLKLITPREAHRRGAQLSYSYQGDLRALSAALRKRGLVADTREPDVIRLTPAPLYTRARDLLDAANILRECAE